MKVVLVILAVIFSLLALAEVGLRVLFDFGNPLIYIADEEIGYLLAPNQRVRRFGNLIEINRYSMRSSTITPLPSDSEGFQDSMPKVSRARRPDNNRSGLTR